MSHIHVRIISMPLPPIIDADELPRLSLKVVQILSHLTGNPIEDYLDRAVGLILLSHKSGLGAVSIRHHRQVTIQ